jgi:RNA-directed DNA polymerase
LLEFDIKGMFDNISRELLLRAVRKHTECKWVILCIERWLKALLQLADGTLVVRTKGTAQGGVVSPVLCKLFMHCAFDFWMGRTFAHAP